jgi:hypothetical protein
VRSTVVTFTVPVSMRPDSGRRSYATEHHYVAERFFGRSANRHGAKCWHANWSARMSDNSMNFLVWLVMSGTILAHGPFVLNTPIAAVRIVWSVGGLCEVDPRDAHRVSAPAATPSVCRRSKQRCQTKTTRKELTPARAIAAAKKMRDQLNDPDSLRVVSFLYYEPEPPDVHFLCVVFRAKNEHGGWSYRPSLTTQRTILAADSTMR